MSLFSRISRLACLVEMLLLAMLIVPKIHAQNTSDQILYAVGNGNRDNTIYRINVDDGLKTQVGIVRKFGSEAGWSPDGKFIYLLDYNDPNHPAMTLIDADTNHRQTLADPLESAPCGLPFEWSPSGKWIAYTTQSDSQRLRKIFNPSNGDGQVLPDANIDFAEIAWSADENYLAYTTASQPESHIWAVWDIQNQQTITVLNPTTWEAPQWSPTENRIIFDPDSDHVIIYNIADGTKQQYASAIIGSWSPDGKFLTLYHSDKDQSVLLSIMDVPANKALELNSEITSISVDGQTAWSSDSRYLAITTGNADNADKKMVYILDVLKKTVQHAEIDPRHDEPFVWSPVDNRLAIASDIDTFDGIPFFTSLWLFDVDHQQSQHYDVKIPLMSYEQRLNWSPTGGYVIVQMDSGVAVLDWAYGKLDLIDNGARSFSRPRWSPDGTRLALVTSGIINRDIYVFTPEGNQLKNITNTLDEIETFLGWRGAKNRAESLSFCGEG